MVEINEGIEQRQLIFSHKVNVYGRVTTSPCSTLGTGREHVFNTNFMATGCTLPCRCGI